MQHSLTAADILPNDTFIKQRPSLFSEIRALKAPRRIAIGLDAACYFENKRTLWWQIQEMLRVENGGQAQLVDEITAYAPLVPRAFSDGSKELVATFMIEINDLEKRSKMLNSLGGIENQISLVIDDLAPIVAIPEDDVERTTEQGKTSAVHFIRFLLTAAQIKCFQLPESLVSIKITHPGYTHEIQLTDKQKEALLRDFD